jgi:hypothetical protein
LSNLDKETIEILHQPVFTTTLDKSFQNPNQPDAVVSTPILFNNATSMTYDRVLMKPKTDDADIALRSLSKAIEEAKQVFKLSAGEVAIIENWKVVHGMVRNAMPPARDVEVIDDDGTYVVTTRF